MKNSINSIVGFVLALCFLAIAPTIKAQNGNGNGATPTPNGVILPSQNNGQGFSNGQGHLNGNSNVLGGCSYLSTQQASDAFASTFAGVDLVCTQRVSPTRVWMAGTSLAACGDFFGNDVYVVDVQLVSCGLQVNGSVFSNAGTVPCVPFGTYYDYCSLFASWGIQP